MRAWRLCGSKHAAFDGEGSRVFGSRWNLKGTRMVNTSGSRSLALIEKLVHTDTDIFPVDHVFVEAEFPDGLIETLDPSTISTQWRETPSPPVLAEFGSRWAREKRSAILRVPSVPMPYEYNFLLNPEHPDFSKITIGKPEPFAFDRRLK